MGTQVAVQGVELLAGLCLNGDREAEIPALAARAHFHGLGIEVRTVAQHDLHDALREVAFAAPHDLDREFGGEREQRLALDEFGFAFHGGQAALMCCRARMTSFLKSW